MNRRLARQIKDYVKTFLRPDNLISSPEVAEKLPGERIVVLSPHFDDDVIGCGGTLHNHALAGNSITIIYMTDGREGDPSAPDKGRLEEMRKEEARRATKILGIRNLVFLDQRETKLSTTSYLIRKLGGMLNDIKPDLLYIPSFLDNHIDHFEINRILLNLAKHLSFSCNVAAYEVWTPLMPNVIVDITSVMHKKEEALKQYTTQLRQVDYVRTTLALNRYRSAVHLKGKGYAEAFLILPLNDYIQIMDESRISKRLFLNLR